MYMKEQSFSHNATGNWDMSRQIYALRLGSEMFYGCFSTVGKPELWTSRFIHHRHLFNFHSFTFLDIKK